MVWQTLPAGWVDTFESHYMSHGMIIEYCMLRHVHLCAGVSYGAGCCCTTDLREAIFKMTILCLQRYGTHTFCNAGTVDRSSSRGQNPFVISTRSKRIGVL